MLFNVTEARIKAFEKIFLKFINGSRWFKMVQDVNKTS